MYIDSALCSTTITLPTSLTSSVTSAIDLSVAGNGKEMKLYIGCTTAGSCISDGGKTVFSVRDSASSGGTYTELVRTASMVTSALDDGDRVLQISLPRDHKQYIKVAAVQSIESAGAGTFDVRLLLDDQTIE